MPSWPTKNQDTSGRHVDGIIEAWHGPVIALIACECGERKGLMWLQAWLGQRLNYRIYALSLLPPHVQYRLQKKPAINKLSIGPRRPGTRALNQRFP